MADDQHERVAQLIDDYLRLLTPDRDYHMDEVCAILRREYGELETDLAETESYLDGLRGDIVKHCPVRTGSEHGETEFLINWRKQWDELKSKLARAREALIFYSDKDNWRRKIMPGLTFDSEIEADLGKVADKTLTEIDDDN